MGHADISVTLNTYTHVNFDETYEDVVAGCKGFLYYLQQKGDISKEIEKMCIRDRFKAAYPKGTDAPALYPWRYAGKFSARAGTPDR